MKIIPLIKSEFLKNYTWKKMIFMSILLTVAACLLVETADYFTLLNSKIKRNDSVYKRKIELLSKKENRTIEEEFDLYSAKIHVEVYSSLPKESATHGYDFRERIVEDLIFAQEQNFLLKIFDDKKYASTIENICQMDTFYFPSLFQGEISHLCDTTNEKTRKELFHKNEKTIEDYSKLVKKDKYYLYVQDQLDKNLIPEEEIEFAKLIVSLKIEKQTDFRMLNFLKFNSLYQEDIESKKEMLEDEELKEFPSYSDYVRYFKQYNQTVRADKAILFYSTKKNIPVDLSYDDDQNEMGYNYMTAKNAVNQVFHLSLVVLLFVSITGSGIVSREHSEGTIKNILTTPVKRSKVLLSKFLYLILHMYILWLICLLAISIYAGIKYGFSDLITPKLIYQNGRVIEVNYYFYLLKEMFLASIPMIAFLSILFFLSAVSLNTALTTSITTILSILPIILYYLCATFPKAFLIFTKTPLFYFDMGFILGQQEFYTIILKKTDISLTIGIMSSLIVIFIFYFLTNFIYCKRDIKNL